MKQKLKKYTTGGQIGNTVGQTAGHALNAVIPGAGVIAAPILGTIGGAIGGLFGRKKQKIDYTMGTASYRKGGKLKKYLTGGKIPMGDGASKFVGPPHEQGGIPVTETGQPTNRQNAVAEVEGGETIQGDYVFSDELIVPGTDMTFAQVHEMLIQEGAPQEQIMELQQMQEQVKMESEGGMEQPMGEEMPMEEGMVDPMQMEQEIPMMPDGGSLPNQPQHELRQRRANVSERLEQARDYLGQTSLNIMGLNPEYTGITLLDAADVIPVGPAKAFSGIRGAYKAFRAGRAGFTKRVPYQGIRPSSTNATNTGYPAFTPQQASSGSLQRASYQQTSPSGRTPWQRNISTTSTKTSQTPTTPTTFKEKIKKAGKNTKKGIKWATGIGATRAAYEIGKEASRSEIQPSDIPLSEKRTGGYLKKLNNGGLTRPQSTPRRGYGDVYRGSRPLTYPETSTTVRHRTFNQNSLQGIPPQANVEEPQQIPDSFSMPSGLIAANKAINNNKSKNNQNEITDPTSRGTIQNPASESSVAERMRSNLDQVSSIKTGSDWTNIGRGVDSALRLGLAAFAPKPEELSEFSTPKEEENLSAFRNALRQTRTGLATNRNQAGYAAFVEGQNRLASAESEYRTGVINRNLQRQFETQRANTEITARNNEALAQHRAKQIELVAGAIQNPINQAAADRTLKQQAINQIYLAAANISGPKEREDFIKARRAELRIARYGGKLKRRKA